ncbi:MAG: ABC transporter permease [Myxococcota bacterium]|nr:ABC transporter permease [Myxococcota bacterium]
MKPAPLPSPLRPSRGTLYLGAGLTSAFVLAALFGPTVAPFGRDALDLAAELSPPSPTHLLGAGENGIDLWSHILLGARLSLGVAVSAVTISLGVGALVGGVAGYLGGLWDQLLMRMVDVVLAFPGILLAIFITAVLGPSVFNVVLALCVTGWTGYARLARAQVLSLREREYVLAARAMGAGHARILLRHILPNAAGPLLVQATFAVPGTILAEASLSFLGLGVPPGTPSWGALIDQGTQYLLVAPHVAIFPGIAIAVTVLGFNFLGDALRDALDPKGAGQR